MGSAPVADPFFPLSEMPSGSSARISSPHSSLGIGLIATTELFQLMRNIADAYFKLILHGE